MYATTEIYHPMTGHLPANNSIADAALPAIIRVMATGLAVNMILAIYLIPVYGILAAAITSTLGATAITIITARLTGLGVLSELPTFTGNSDHKPILAKLN